MESPKPIPLWKKCFRMREVEIVLNLTRPFEHYATTKAALRRESTYTVKSRWRLLWKKARSWLPLAREKDCFSQERLIPSWGGGSRLRRKLIDDGFIGWPIGATAQMIRHRHESWHPAPAFTISTEAAPMMDMGPYYMTALVNLLGGVKGLTGLTAKSFETRTITSAPSAVL